jgi:hypothetical protein
MQMSLQQTNSDRERAAQRTASAYKTAQATKRKVNPEWFKCAASVVYFIIKYCKIYDAKRRDWISFQLWAEQEQTLESVHLHQLVVILKARQLGLTWLVLCYALWTMLFCPIATVLIFSLRETEAVYLLGEERLRGIYNRLPDFLKVGELDTQKLKTQSATKQWRLANGSVAKAFPTTAGDSYTATLAIVDEADLVPDLKTLMGRVKPTIEAGGKMILLSRVNKKLPNSEFKKIYKAAKKKLNEWFAIFLPWFAHPERDEKWYEKQVTDSMNSGSLDDVHEQYPATDTEALAPRSLDKRIPPVWILNCYEELEPLPLEKIKGAPAIPNFKIFKKPEPNKKYVIGIDPAEGNPTSDDSALTVMDFDTGEEVASLSDKLQPAVIAAHADEIGKFYNRASLMVERNNHGHAVLLWFKDNSRLMVLLGLDGRPGWLDNSRGKAILYNECADAFRTVDTTVHNFDTFIQLSSIEGSSLLAPDGEPDDLSDSYALCCVARAHRKPPRKENPRGALARAIKSRGV